MISETIAAEQTIPIIELTERVNNDICDKLCNITYEEYLNLMKQFDENECDELNEKLWIIPQYNKIVKYTRMMKNNNYKIKQSYKYANGTTDGRLFVNNKASSAGLQNINKYFRGCLCDNLYVDIDMKNAHPNLLAYICTKNKIKCPKLYDFINDRDNKYVELMEETDITRQQAKVMFIKCFNSKYLTTSYMKGKRKTKIKNKFFLAFDSEMKKIQQQLINKYSDVKNDLIKRGKGMNINGCLVNKLLCNLENQILSEAREELQIDMSVLCFDGFMMEKNKYKPSIINDLNKLTSKYNIEWDIKDHDVTLYYDIMNISNNEQKKFYYANNTIDLAETLLKYEFNDVLYNNAYKQIYYFIDGVLCIDRDTIKESLFKYLINIELIIKGKDDDIIANKNVKLLDEIVLLLIRLAPVNLKILDDLWSDTIYKLHFNNGYYDFKLNKFITDKSKYKTFNRINYDLNLESNKTVRQEIIDKIFSPMFGIDSSDDEEQIQLLEYFLYRMARIIAGEIEDKIWIILQGNRDCGKGVFSDMLYNSFKSYVGTTNSENFLYKKTSGDSAKELSWLIPYSFKRLAITQEIKCNENEEIDGSKIKKFVSGGDYIEARQNFKDETSFKLQSSLMMCVNDTLPINPADTYEKCETYEFSSRFIDDTYNGLKLSNVKYYSKDDKLKSSFLTRQDVINEFTLMIIESYYKKDLKYPENIKKHILEDNFENMTDDRKLQLIFTQGDNDDKLSTKEIKDVLEKNKISITLNKFNKLISGIYNVEKYKSGNNRGIKGLKIVDV